MGWGANDLLEIEQTTDDLVAAVRGHGAGMTDRDWARLGILYHQWRQEQARHATLVHELVDEELKRRDEYWTAR